MKSFVRGVANTSQVSHCKISSCSSGTDWTHVADVGKIFKKIMVQILQ